MIDPLNRFADKWWTGLGERIESNLNYRFFSSFSLQSLPSFSLAPFPQHHHRNLKAISSRLAGSMVSPKKHKNSLEHDSVSQKHWKSIKDFVWDTRQNFVKICRSFSQTTASTLSLDLNVLCVYFAQFSSWKAHNKSQSCQVTGRVGARLWQTCKSRFVCVYVFLFFRFIRCWCYVMWMRKMCIINSLHSI